MAQITLPPETIKTAQKSQSTNQIKKNKNKNKPREAELTGLIDWFFLLSFVLEEKRELF
jgi:hypothetical protein